MITEGLLDVSLFSLWLSAVPFEEPAGELVFGAVNGSRVNGPAKYFSVPQNT